MQVFTAFTNKQANEIINSNDQVFKMKLDNKEFELKKGEDFLQSWSEL